METMFGILNLHSNIKDKPDALPLPDPLGDIEFKNVTFGYDPSRPLLQDVSFTIKPGSKVAIVGGSGTG